MRIKSLKLDNFCQYHKAEFDFNAPLVGIVGPNGKGKTNLTRAIKTLLLGAKFERLGKGRDDVSWGQEAGKLEGVFEFRGREALLRRSLVSSTCSLTYGEEKLTKSVAVEQRILELLGVDPRILSEIVFVGQGEIEKIVFQPSAERKEAFYQLLGLARLEKVRELLGDKLRTLVVDSAAEELRSATERLAEAAGLVTASEAELRSLNNLLSAEEEARLRKVSADGRRAAELQGQLAQLKIEYQEATAEVERLQTACQGLAGRRFSEETKLASLQSAYAAAEQTLRTYESAKVTADLRAQLLVEEQEVKLEAERPEPEKPEAYDEEQRIIDKLLQDVGPHLAAAKKAVQAVAGSKDFVCPTCAQPLPAEKLAEFKAYIGNNDSGYAEFQEKSRQLAEASRVQRTAHDQWESTVSSARNRLRQIQSRLATLSTAKPAGTEEAEAARTVVADYERQKSLAAGLVVQEQTLKMEHGRAVTRQFRAAQYTRMEAELAALGTDAASLQSAELRLQEHETAKRKEAEILGRLSPLRDNLVRLTSDVERFNKHEESLAGKREFKELAERARTVLHRDHLPRLAATAYLKELNYLDNRYLSRFSAPFSAFINEDLDFQCVFSDGEKRPAERLSGAQKTILGLAFRLAVHELFAGSVGLLVLDEPSVFLDNDNINALRELLRSLRSWAAGAGLQIIVPTHEERLIDVFDKLIQL